MREAREALKLKKTRFADQAKFSRTAEAVAEAIVVPSQGQVAECGNLQRLPWQGSESS